jgi:tetratricopeptide (TPR) repeat protein
MMAALEAAEAEGGDIRGRQSAAILVVAAEPSGRPWQDRIFDLRVEDSREPLVELRRLLSVARAYRHMNEGDEQVTRGDVDAALQQYEAAEALLPGESEPIFWHAVTLASVGRVEESLPLFAEAYRLRPEWRELVPRLVPAGLLPEDPEMMEEIVSAGN